MGFAVKAARALRAAADRLDPQPPHMREALTLLGWTWDAPRGVYMCRGRWDPSRDGTSNNTNGTVRWYYGNVEGEEGA